jgi:hypothetical protein
LRFARVIEIATGVHGFILAHRAGPCKNAV